MTRHFLIASRTAAPRRGLTHQGARTLRARRLRVRDNGACDRRCETRARRLRHPLRASGAARARPLPPRRRRRLLRRRIAARRSALRAGPPTRLRSSPDASAPYLLHRRDGRVGRVHVSDGRALDRAPRGVRGAAGGQGAHLDAAQRRVLQQGASREPRHLARRAAPVPEGPRGGARERRARAQEQEEQREPVRDAPGLAHSAAPAQPGGDRADVPLARGARGARAARKRGDAF